jgi:predicted ATPase
MKVLDSSHYIIDVSLKSGTLPDTYPFTLPVISNLKGIEFHPKVTFLVGENGAGKSTLLEAIAISMGMNAEGGSKNFNFSTRQTHSNLSEYLQVTKGIKLPKDTFFLRAETFYNVATEVDNLSNLSSYGGKSLHEQSHGESFISLIENRFKGEGLYILDEPEAALSPSNQLKLLALIKKYTDLGSQFIIATHSPIIMGYPDADIYVLDEKSVSKINYEESSHFQLTKYFLNHREKVLDDLFNEGRKDTE